MDYAFQSDPGRGGDKGLIVSGNIMGLYAQLIRWEVLTLISTATLWLTPQHEDIFYSLHPPPPNTNTTTTTPLSPHTHVYTCV